VAIPDFLKRTVGQWSGNSKLMLPGEPDRESESKLTLAPTAKGRLITLSYTWKCDGEEQEGMLLLSGVKEGAVASWVDSWHNGDKIMAMRGKSGAGNVTLLGSYAAPPGPDWGWRFVISEEGLKLKLIMTNISPQGEEEPAVEAEYERVAGV
jgi:hypothetical protein